MMRQSPKPCNTECKTEQAPPRPRFLQYVPGRTPYLPVLNRNTKKRVIQITQF